MIKTRLLLVLAAIVWSTSGQEEFYKNTWQMRYFGSPERIYFLPKQKALLVDSKGFGLIDTQSGNLDYIVSEKNNNSGLVNNQLVLFNSEQKKVYLMDPYTGLLLADKKLKNTDFFDLVIHDDALYFISETSITREKQDEEVRMDFEGKKIIKASFADLSTSKLQAFVEEPDIHSLCLYQIDSSLHKMERKNCTLIPVEFRNSSKIVNAFNTPKGMIIIYEGFFVTEDREKIPFFVDEGSSARALLKDSFEEFLRGVRLEETHSKKFPQILQKSGCVRSSDINTRYHIKEVCAVNGSSSKVEISLANGSAFEILLVDNQEPVVDFFSDPEKQRLIVKTAYDTLIAINLPEKRQIWRRDEGPANLVAVMFLQNPTNEQSFDFIRVYEQLLAEGKILRAWHLRIDHGVREFFQFLANLKANLSGYLSSSIQRNLIDLTETVTGGALHNKINGRVQMPDFKTSKTAIFVSKSGKLFAFDLATLSFTANMLLDYPIKFESKERELPKYHFNDSSPKCQVFKHDSLHLLVSCTNQPRFLINYKLEKTDTAIPNPESNSSSTHKYAFKFNEEAHEFVGVYQNERIWNLELPPSQQIVVLQRIQDLKIPKFAHVIENKNVLYRVVDPNNALLVTKAKEGYYIRIINLKFGKIIFEIFNDKISSTHKLEFLVDDGSFFVNYFNSETLQNELLHIEIFRKKVENDFTQIIKALFSGREAFLAEIDYSLHVPEYIITHKRYALPFTVKTFIAFDSKNDLTSKNLLIITESDQIYSLPRSLISTRRIFESEKPKVEEQLNKPNKAKIPVTNYFKSLTLPGYDYYIPLDPKKFITKHVTVSGAEHVWVEPTNFESTSIVVSGGKEIFIGAHAPDNKFDQLPEDFSKAKLWAVCILFIGAILVTNRMVRSKRPMEKYLASA